MKITELPVLTENELSVNDVIPILDVSSNTTKKVPILTVRGNTSNANSKADITSLCTSGFSLYNVQAQVLCGQLARLFISINNADSNGIPYTTALNYFTLPSDLFESVVTIISVRARSANAPNPANTLVTPHFFYFDNLTLKTTCTRDTPKNLHSLPDFLSTTGGNFISLGIDILAILKPDVVLPYSS